jgi:two-component system phosphate regulon sensor histidine kinase PhoR
MRADFVANASHELRTPLASIAGFIETLQGHAKDDAAARERFLAIMASEADRMRRLIDGLLSLSRIEANEHNPPQGVCDVAAKASEVVGAMTPMFEARGLRADLASPPAGEALAIGDADEIGQAIRNLADNAAKQAPAGGAVRIEVFTRRLFDPSEAIGDLEVLRAAGGGGLALVSPGEPAEHGYVAVVVRDDGAGIAREHLPRLAERFYRASEQKSGGGAGLGLAIVKHIVSRHRGGLVVRSAPGAGAAFLLYWPRAAVAKGSSNRHKRRTSRAQAGAPR